MDYFGYLNILCLICQSLSLVDITGAQYHGDYILSPHHTHNHPSKLLFKPSGQASDDVLPTQVPWEEVLKETVFHTLNNKKRRIVDGAIQKNSKFKEAIVKAPYIGEVDPNAPRFGDIVLLAKGQLIKNRDDSFYFLQMDSNTNKPHNISINATAVWKVEQIRHRSADSPGGHKFDLKFTVFPLEKQDVTIDRELSKRIGKSFILKDDDYPKYFFGQTKRARSYGTAQSERPETATRRMFFGPDIFGGDEPQYYQPPELGSAFNPVQHVHVHQYKYRPDLNTGELYMHKTKSRSHPFPYAMPYVPLASTNRIRFPEAVRSSSEKSQFESVPKVKYATGPSAKHNTLVDLRGASDTNKLGEQQIRVSTPRFVPNTFPPQNTILIGNQHLHSTIGQQPHPQFQNQPILFSPVSSSTVASNGGHTPLLLKIPFQFVTPMNHIIVAQTEIPITSLHYTHTPTPTQLHHPTNLVSPLPQLPRYAIPVDLSRDRPQEQAPKLRPIFANHYEEPVQRPQPQQLTSPHAHYNAIPSSFKESPRLNQNFKYSEPDPLYENGRYIGRPSFSSTVAPQIETPIITSTQYYEHYPTAPSGNDLATPAPDFEGATNGPLDDVDMPTHKPDSINAQLPPPERGHEVVIPYVEQVRPVTRRPKPTVKETHIMQAGTGPAYPTGPSSSGQGHSGPEQSDPENSGAGHTGSNNSSPGPSSHVNSSPGHSSHSHASPGHSSPGYTSPGYTSPGLSSPGQSGPEHSSPGHSSLGHLSPGHSSGGLSSPGHSSGGLSSPGHSSPGHSSPGHSSPGHSNSGYSSPGHSSPAHSSEKSGHDGFTNYATTSQGFLPLAQSTGPSSIGLEPLGPSGTGPASTDHDTPTTTEVIVSKLKNSTQKRIRDQAKAVGQLKDDNESLENYRVTAHRKRYKTTTTEKPVLKWIPKKTTKTTTTFKPTLKSQDSGRTTRLMRHSNEDMENVSKNDAYSKKRVEGPLTDSVVEKKRKLYGHRRRLGPKFTTSTAQPPPIEDAQTEESREVSHTHTEKSLSTSVSVEIGGQKQNQSSTECNDTTGCKAEPPYEMVKADLKPIQTNTTNILLYKADSGETSAAANATTTSEPSTNALEDITYSILNHARAISSTPRPSRRQPQDLKFIKKRRRMDLVTTRRGKATIEMV